MLARSEPHRYVGTCIYTLHVSLTMKTVMISGFGCPLYLVSCFFLIIYEKQGKKEIKLRMEGVQVQ